jgi:D-3-phosphoglycerate dehydrogenase
MGQGPAANDRPRWSVLVTDIAWPTVEPEAQVLSRVGARLVVADSGSEKELLGLVRDADAILTCWACVPSSVVRAGRNLQVIGRYGIGTDNIAVAEATKQGIIVTNVPTYCLDEVSDHAMALLLACARQVCQYDARAHGGNWDVKGGIPLRRLRGKTLGIIGFGNIGRTLALKARAFGLRVAVADPYVDGEAAAAHGCEWAELEVLLRESDYISIHTPLNQETRGMINETALRMMKPTAFVINTARGAIIDQDALVGALQKGWIAGAAMDVFVPERLPDHHPLLQLPNVIVTPHVAFYSEESVLELEVKAAENVATVLAGRRPPHVVNPSVLSLPRWAHLR